MAAEAKCETERVREQLAAANKEIEQLKETAAGIEGHWINANAAIRRRCDDEAAAANKRIAELERLNTDLKRSQENIQTAVNKHLRHIQEEKMAPYKCRRCGDFTGDYCYACKG
jgi:predicted  nucleic acid-binding Zn-ribbon protein